MHATDVILGPALAWEPGPRVPQRLAGSLQGAAAPAAAEVAMVEDAPQDLPLS